MGGVEVLAPRARELVEQPAGRRASTVLLGHDPYGARGSKIRSIACCTERSTSAMVMRPSAHARRRVASTLLTVATMAAAVSGSIDDNALMSVPTLRAANWSNSARAFGSGELSIT